MRCSNCHKPFTGLGHDHSGNATVNGTVNRTRFVRVVNCGPCEEKIKIDMQTSKDRAAKELADLKKQLGL